MSEDMRERYAAIFRHAPGTPPPGDETPGVIADLILAVRDEEMEQLRNELAEVRAFGVQQHDRADYLSGALNTENRAREKVEAKLPKCNGMCLTASDVDVPVAGNPVARAHRSCPLHGDLEAVAWEQDAALRAADTQTERACKILTEVLVIWTEQRAYHQERAERKGYAHDEAAAEVYGAAIKVATDTIAVLNSPSGES